MNKEVTIDIENPKDNDVISREDALMALTGEWTEITDEIIHRFIRRIKALPSVNPQKMIGHWIENAPEYQNIDPPYICSECGNFHLRKTNYCDQCGARMIELQENEADNG